jgi:hypothetical protein
MGINSFNPDDPESQPEYVYLNILGNYTDPFKIKVQITWGDATALVWLIPDDPSTILPIENWTNKNLINNDPIGFTTDGDYDDFVNEIEDILLETGKMPDGNYVMDLGVYTLDEQLISNVGVVTITIQSPQAIDLITPGSPFGLPLVLMSNQYPQFLWTSNFNEYNFYIYEIDESINSPEEIETMEPYFQNQFPISTTIYEYPPGADPLLPGHTYAWRITAETVTPMTSQNVTMKSSFYVFRIDSNSAPNPPIDPIVVQNLINQFAGAGQGAQELLNLLQNGYNVETIIWEGEEITLEELMSILNSGQYEPVQ